MVVAITIVGSRDPRLEELIRSSGLVTATSWVADISTVVDAHAAPPDVVLIDVRKLGYVPSELPLLKKQHPAMNLMLLMSSLDAAVVLQAMRAGVTECIAEPFVQTEFNASLNRLVGQRTVAPAGPVFAFIGAKGGVGTTTLAVNVATTLARMSSSSTLMIDSHLVYGDAAVFLGVDARFSVLDALENLHRFDRSFFKSLVVRAPSGLDLLASSDRPPTTVVDTRRLGTVIEFASSQYRYTVVDVPRSDMAVVDSLDNASTIVVVTNQELATVRNAGRMASTLRARYRNAKVMTVINRTDRRSEIGHQDIERAVGGPIVHQFPSDYRRALHAMNKGRPLSLDNHNDLSASFNSLARELAGVGAERPADRSSGGILGLFPGRKS